MDQKSFDALTRHSCAETIVFMEPLELDYVKTIRTDRFYEKLTDVFVPTHVAEDLLRLRIGKKHERGKLVRLIRPCIKDDRDHPAQYGWLDDVAVHALPPVYADASLVLVAMAWKENFIV